MDRYVGRVYNFLSSISSQQRFEMVGQCYSSITAESFIRQTKDSTLSRHEVRLTPEGRPHLSWFPLFICFVSSLWACTMQIRASQEGGLFVLPEVLTRFQWFFLYSLFLGFSFCLLVTTIWTPFSYFNYLTNITVTSIMLLLSHFSRVRLCATPPHWSGLPFPSPMHESEKWKWSRKSCPTFSDCMDCSPPGSFVHGIFQARVLEWGAIAFSDLYHS